MIPIKDLNPRVKFPFITILLILSNVFIYVFFLLKKGTADQVIANYALYPVQFRNLLISMRLPDNYNFLMDLVTYMFLHGSWMHLIGNCWFLWIFGDNVEGVMGHFRYLIFYLISGVFACFVHIAITSTPEMPIIGASGAIAGVMGAYLILFPRSKILTFVPLIFIWFIPIPAFIFLILWFVGQLLSGVTTLFSSEGMSNIAFWAHIGGFLVGIIGGINNRKRKEIVYRKKYYTEA